MAAFNVGVTVAVAVKVGSREMEQAVIERELCDVCGGGEGLFA